jgi:hypothetical protein
VPGLTAAAAGSDWTYGGSILTLVFPVLLFLIVATALYVLFTKPQVVPGHRDQTNGRSVSYTRVAGPASEVGPAAGGQAATAEGGQAATAEGEGR